ncbi:MAG: hypothetical protein Q7S06_03185 [Nanoarchaeota archaeon]|nr:hypothetical protein [Nanoarchaeota archaeon]
MKLDNKKGQVATTLTWVVATIIIVIILAISLLATAAFGKRSYSDKDMKDRTDLLVTKSLLSYLSTINSQKTVFEQISNEKDFNSFNKELRDEIFDSLYEKEYPFKILVKLNTFKIGGVEVSNIQLGGAIPTIIERIKIIDDLWIEANTINR